MKNTKLPRQDNSNRSKIGKNVTALKNYSKDLYLRLDFTYLNTKYECFSEWEKEKLKKLSNYIERHRAMKREEIRMDNSGKDCTERFNDYMKRFSDRFSDDILPIMAAKHLYIGGSERLHGFIHQNIFYALRLDSAHKVN
jgi:cysteinyl-tRNA synthetase